MKRYILKSISKLTDTCYELNLIPKYKLDTLEFRAGQYIALSIQGKAKKSTVRCFSIANSSLRNDGSLNIGIRLGSKYTKLIKASILGTEVFIEGPFGEFTPDLNSSRGLVLIAGGIGITPMVSIIETISSSKSNRQTILLYFNNHIEDVPYLNNIKRLSNHDWLKPYIILRSGSTDFPNTTTGKLDITQILKVIDSQNNTDYYICGPAGFMRKAVQLLLENSTPMEDIHTESFGVSPAKSGSRLSASSITYIVSAAMIVLSVGAIATKDFIQKELKKIESSERSEEESLESESSKPSKPIVLPEPKQSNGTYQSPRSTVS